MGSTTGGPTLNQHRPRSGKLAEPHCRMNASTNLWDQLDAELRPRLTSVGFRQTDFPATPKPQMDGVVYKAFEAPYALLFCVQIPSEDPHQITAVTNFACDTMRAELAKAGANDWTRDGYVIAAIPSSSASPEAKESLR